MFVLAFDRDWTVDLNPHPTKEAVPIDWVTHWAHFTDHEVWAIGNQKFVYEAGIPGVVELIRRYHGDLDILGEQDENGRYEWWPARERRLELLAEVFPDASNYIVVDDLDLSHVEQWDHYHAWEFVELLKDGSSIPGLRPPSIQTNDADSEYEYSEHVQTIREKLQQASKVKVYLDDDKANPFRSRSWKKGRPSATPPGEPGPINFSIVSGETIRTKLPEISEVEILQRDPDAEDAGSRIESTQLDESEIPDAGVLLGRARQADVFTTEQRVEFAIDVLKIATKLEAFSVKVGATFAEQVEDEAGEDAPHIRRIGNFAREYPTILTEYTEELCTLARLDNQKVSRQALKCLTVVAEEDSQHALDAGPTLSIVIDGDDSIAQKEALYIISRISEDHPESILPTLDSLLEFIEAADATNQTNALSAIGRVASEYPNTVDKIVDSIVPLLESDANQVRNNAVGLMADIATEYPATVVEYADQISLCLNDENDQARINASIALNRAGKADPSLIRSQKEVLVASLEDRHPEVRANVFTLIGNAHVDIDPAKVEKLAEGDPKEQVREQANWALQRIK